MSTAADRPTAADGQPSLTEPIAGRYRVLEQLGTGGVGAVYRVHDDVGDTALALKLLLSARSGSRRRKLETLFQREYYTLARLKHPSIIQVFDYGLTESGPYYTMELLDGGDLQQHAPLPWRDVCRHLCDVASSLALLHARRLVHRDITPRNIRLTSEGRAKLIDFGALSAFGPALDVVGTPLCMAPEVLRRGELDQRSDLFALGVVGYFALTGKHAFPARSSEELPEFWRVGPLPPEQLVPEIPRELSSLLLSMMRPDPVSRPLHAAQVIDQLCAIAGIALSDAALAAESYLASGRLVGRALEQEWLGHRLTAALAGHGCEVLLGGAPGVGKTRMLHEIGLDAQLLGTVTLRADAQATSGYFGVAVRLALELLERGGATARAAATPHAGVLAALSATLCERLHVAQVDALPPHAAEQRTRFQAALLAWFSAAAIEQPLLLLVDNLHAADESSAAFLVALGKEALTRKLSIMCALRDGEDCVSPQAIAVLRARGTHLPLEALSRGACNELVQSLFGEVANGARLAKLLYDKSAGNPQHCMELARLLARTGAAKYVASTWVLSTQVSGDELPDRLEDVLAVKLASLDEDARAMAYALCLHSKPVSLENCVAFAEGLSEVQAHAALTSLLGEQILISSDGRYQFAQQSLRAKLIGKLPLARAQALHRCAARVLAGSEELELQMQRGWHLLHAGEELAGAELLASVSRAFIYMASAREESQSVIAALRAALDVYERNGRSPHERATLLFPLVLLCYYCPDHSLILQYAPKALRLGRQITGLGLAQRLQPYVGKQQALSLAMARAEQRFARARERSRGLTLTLAQAIAGFSSIVPASMGAFGCHYDTDGAEALGRFAEPLALFGDDQLPALIYGWMQAQLHMVRGLDGDAHGCISRVLSQMDQPVIRQTLGDAHWRSLHGGAMFILGLVACYRGSPAACDIADAMDRTSIRLWALVADQVRLLHHCYRGEASRVQYYRERVERSAMLGGPTWHTDLFWPAAMLHGEVLCGDTIAVRRTWEQLDRTANKVPTLRVHADCAQAAYLSLRGDHVQAIALYARVTQQLAPRRSVGWLPIRGQFAQALNRAGAHAHALQVARDTLVHVTEVDRSVRVLCFEARRQLAVAHAGLGSHELAIAALEQLITEYEPDGNPLLLGLLHETRAQIAHRIGDRAAVCLHLAQADKQLRSTENPVLIARLGQLEQLWAVRPKVANDADSTSLYSLTALSAPVERQRHALELLLAHARARAGALYLRRELGLQLVASVGSEPPPAALERELRARVDRAQTLLDSLDALDEDTKVYDSSPAGPLSDTIEITSSLTPRQRSQPALRVTQPPAAGLQRQQRVIVPATGVGGIRKPIGGVILMLEPGTSGELDPQLLHAIAEALS
jgi:tetratricopeptide (TPR) repeat protein